MKIQKRKSTKIQKTIWLGFGVASAATGTYMLMLVFSPAIYQPYDPKTVEEKVAVSKEYNADTIIIPKIGVDVPFASGDAAVMEKGAWHRFPERGDPASGGNFILSAHRFQMTYDPIASRHSSPFYNIDKLNVGDSIDVVYNKQQYTYQVQKKYSVKPWDIYIEAPSKDPKLTLYSCTLKGESDGRDVIEAKLLPKNAQASADTGTS
ncbi:MAG TPA: class E sortase [Candidatus Saccharimonadales bacterium]|nr:class E sortase [Candidatus Saccharimonadales bacterium]